MLILYPRIYSKQKKIKGFSLVEIIVFTGIIALITGLIILFFLKLFTMSQNEKAYAGALVVAKNRIEYIRNLPYEKIGTQGGIPQGDIPQEENIVFNNISYNVKTEIFYIDDPYDGTLENGTDEYPTDYKRIRIKVSWENPPSGSPVYLSTDIAPKDLESYISGGVIKILVLNASGNPVTYADVNITNSKVSPEININTQTDENGEVVIIGAPSCIECYHIVVTKTGYSTDQTYERTEENVNPKPADISVFDKKVSSITFSIDKLSSMNVKLYDYQTDTPLSNVNITIFGSKVIGEDSEGNPILKYSQNFISDTQGSIDVQDLEFDNYDFTPEQSFDIAEAIPIIPVYVEPNSQVQQILKLYPHTDYHLWVIVVDSENNPLPSASVTLENTEIPYSETKSTSEYGQTFFPNLQAKEYSISVSLEGYEEYQDTIDIGNVSKAKITLNPL